MKKDPLVTVLMAVYNGERYLKSSIESVLNQTFGDFEFLIINDCSTDDSVKMCESFNDERIMIHHNEQNIGQTKSLNVGLKIARGKYIARMDADDKAFPAWLEKLTSYAESHQGYAAIGVTAYAINKTGKLKKILRTPKTFEEVIFHTFFGNAMNHVGALINREILLKMGGYNEEFRITQDYELWSSLIRNNYRLNSIDDALVAVRVHESSLGYVAEKGRGLMEVSETIHRNVRSLSTLKISFEDAVRLRMFYRFPENLSLEDFSKTHILYKEIFSHLKKEVSIGRELIKYKMRKTMLIPYSKRIIFEIENKQTDSARHLIKDYQNEYGFNMTQLLLYIVSFLGRKMLRGLLLVYMKMHQKAVNIKVINDVPEER